MHDAPVLQRPTGPPGGQQPAQPESGPPPAHADVARQVADLGGAVRSELEALEPLRSIDVRSELDAARKAVSQVHAQVELMAQEHEGAQAGQSSLREELGRTAKRVEETVRGAVDAALAELRAEVAAKLQALSGELAHASRVGEVAAEVGALSGRVQELAGQAQTLDGEVQAAGAEAQAAAQALAARVAAAESQLVSMGERVRATVGEAELEALGGRVREVEQGAVELARRLGELSTDCEADVRVARQDARAAAEEAAAAKGEAAAAKGEAAAARQEARAVAADEAAATRAEVSKHVSERLAAVQAAVAAHIAEQVSAVHGSFSSHLKEAATRADAAKKAARASEKRGLERVAAAAVALREEAAQAHRAQAVAVDAARSEAAESAAQLGRHVAAGAEAQRRLEQRVAAAEQRAAAADQRAAAAEQQAQALREALRAEAREAVRAELDGGPGAAGGGVAPALRALEARVAAVEGGKRERKERGLAREVAGLRAHLARLGGCLEERSRDLGEMAETLAGVARQVFAERRGAGYGSAGPLFSSSLGAGDRRAGDESVAQFDAFMARMKRRLREAEAEARELRKVMGQGA